MLEFDTEASRHPNKTLRSRCGEPGGRCTNLCEMHQGIELTFILREVGGIGVWAALRGRTLVYWGIAGGADLKLGELII